MVYIIIAKCSRPQSAQHSASSSDLYFAQVRVNKMFIFTPATFGGIERKVTEYLQSIRSARYTTLYKYTMHASYKKQRPEEAVIHERVERGVS